VPLRRRISLVAAASVAVAVAVAVMICYFAVRDQMVSQIDGELRAQAQLTVDTLRGMGPLPSLSAKAGGPAPYSQVVLPNGTVQYNPHDGIKLPQTRPAELVADGTRPPYMTSVWVGGAHLRMYTFQLTGQFGAGLTSVAVQEARPLASVDNVLSDLKPILAAVFLLVVGLAAVLARLATRRVLMPLAEVTATAEAIAATEDLDRRIEVRADDEVGQLARRFNEMLERLATSREALDESVIAQRLLVADASHELRTPVTSLRTNIEILIESGAILDEEERHRLLDDVVEQCEELSTLVSDLIEVARGDLPPETIEDTRLDQLVEEALHRARRNSPQTPFSDTLEPVAVQGNSERLTRAINNLLDNAARHTQPGTPVEISVDTAGVTVRDHGNGIAGEDLPHVFDRFYRGADSRARQGSGLGLAIVKQVAEQHGGTVTAANAPDGGAVFRLLLPASAVSDEAGVASHAELTAQ
jgi:two-component system, OmpR family, sensor histidine kinase MprB